MTVTAAPLRVESIAGTHNGTVLADGELTISLNTVLFGSCSFRAISGDDLGELKEGKPATLALEATLTRVSGACLSTATLTAEYTLTEPKEKTLSVEPLAPLRLKRRLLSSPRPVATTPRAAMLGGRPRCRSWPVGFNF